ncbi:MAG TPA: site-2 protease family protein [Candidatus Heimdallarchaeota archaeon]|nr:site-2 protease family protein [Candidatus Heimdallarchaeota archaeon]
MFGKSITLFKLFGFEVKIDISWLVIALLITWTLAKGSFPHYYQGFQNSTYWIMGILGALGLFIAIIFHELSHSLVAQKFGIPMKGITLFIFGGVAEMTEEPPSPKAEFFMAIAGPISSIILGLGLFGVRLLGEGIGWSKPVLGVISYLALINLILAGFNLLPAFPLDGGRMLRSVLWGMKDNLRWATRIASSIGSAFGIALILFGVLSVFMGNLIGGVWWVLIGMFMRGASQMSYQQLLVRRSLEGEKVRRFMVSDPVSVSPSISVEDLVEDYIYKYHFKMFPVVEDGKLLGCVTLNQVKEIPREERHRQTIRGLAKSCTKENTVGPDEDAMKVLAIMNKAKSSRLMVVEGDKLLGVIALKDMLEFLSLKVDLED